MDRLFFNGIDGNTGRYLLPPMSREQLVGALRRHPSGHEPTARGLIGDPHDLASAGWAVLFGSDVDPGVEEALAPLIALRKAQAQAVDERRFRRCVVRPEESKVDLLRRHNLGRGPVDPRRLPYYLLLVGDLESIPFRLQHQLSAQYAVGRLALPTTEAYAHYARSVVDSERASTQRKRCIDLFGVAHDGDPATLASAHELIEPLAQGIGHLRSWKPRSYVGRQANKNRLLDLLEGQHTPALIISASHGLGLPRTDPRQSRDQGALLCDDWPGPAGWRGRIPRGHYLSAEDVGETADVRGLVLFLFGCYSAGTPRWDTFSFTGSPTQIADRAMIASLPQRLLGHPRGGALAIIGHIDRAWAYSFRWGATEQLAVYEAMLKRLLARQRIGHALEYFHQRYGELATELATALHPTFGTQPRDGELLELWLAANDARNYVLLGDPATRLAVEDAA